VESHIAAHQLVEDFDSPQLSEFMKSILEAYPIFDLDVRHVCSSLQKTLPFFLGYLLPE